MLRFVVSVVAILSVSRWIYSEAELLAPKVVPAFDFVLQKTTIPTHDQWSKESVNQLLGLMDQVSKIVISSTNTVAVYPPPTRSHTNSVTPRERY